MADVGRPSLLTKELLAKIKQSILDGNTYEETANLCGIEPNTFYRWTSDNYCKISDLIFQWENERRLGKSIKKLEQLVDSEEEKIALGASTFFAETLGKKTFSKRSELTGADGADLLPKPLLGGLSNNNELPSNNSNEETGIIEEAN